jgi:hypothetical protein
MILCRPVGKGNWHLMRLSTEGPLGLLGLVKVGHRFELGGITWRVVEVRT